MSGLGTKKQPLILRVQSMEKAEEISAFCKMRGWHFMIGIEPNEPEDLADLKQKLSPPTVQYEDEKIGRNETCPCGSGKKYKKCCLQENLNT